VFSAIWSDFPFETLYSSLQLLLISFFAISCSSLFSVRYIFSMIYSVFSLIVFFSFVFVIFIPDYGIDIFNGESSFRGVFVEKNRLGQILAYYFALSFFFIRWKFFSVAVFFMALFLLVGNRSMTALLLTISIPFIIFIARFFIGNNKNIYINTVTISFFSIFVFTIFLVNYYDLLNFLGKDPTLTGRTEIWELGVYAFLDRPLFGYGYSSFWSSNSPHGGQFIQWSLVWGPSSMHNGWFEILLQLGLIGLVLYLFFFLMALKLTVYYLNSGSSRKLGKSLFVLFFMIIFWSLMQHNLLRHQAFSHYMLLILFSSIFFYKRCK
jgi:exopolysaccharide production protein ExoQ